MKETPVHPATLDYAKRASVRERKNGFGTERGRDRVKFSGNLIESNVPGNPLESTWPGAALGRNSSHGKKQPVRGVHTIQVLGDFAAEKSTRDRMFGIAFNARGASIFYGDQDRTGVRTIVRASCVYDAGHTRL